MRLQHWERAALLVTAVLLIYPSWIADVIGLVMLAPVLLRHLNPSRRVQSPSAVQG
jgi:UPF0716 family protein affecting phage T7 exclusion